MSVAAHGYLETFWCISEDIRWMISTMANPTSSPHEVGARRAFRTPFCFSNGNLVKGILSGCLACQLHSYGKNFLRTFRHRE